MAGKKSKDPNAARELTARGRLGFGRSIHEQKLKRPANAEYRRIMDQAFYRWSTRGRRNAVQYLNECRSWLAMYQETLGLVEHEFPSSGALLDGLITQKALERKTEQGNQQREPYRFPKAPEKPKKQT
jgi:hypothetical protein